MELKLVVNLDPGMNDVSAGNLGREIAKDILDNYEWEVVSVECEVVHSPVRPTTNELRLHFDE